MSARTKILTGGKPTEKIMHCVFLLSALVSIAALILICVFMFANGIPAIVKIGLDKFLLGLRWKPSIDLYGIFPMIVGSIVVTLGAIILGVPLGVFTAVFLARFCPSKIYSPIESGIKLLAGIPSVVLVSLDLQLLFLPSEMFLAEAEPVFLQQALFLQ